MHSRAPPRFSSFSPYRFPFPLEFLSQLCTNLHAPWTSLALVLLARSLGALSVELPPRVSPPRPGDTDSSRREERGELFSFKSTWPFPPPPPSFRSHSLAFSSATIAIFAATKICPRVRGNNFHVPFVFANRPCSRYPNSRSLASFSFSLV